MQTALSWGLCLGDEKQGKTHTAAQVSRKVGPILYRRWPVLTGIRAFQFRDIRPKAASEMDLEHASKLLGHAGTTITEKVYRRVGETVKPTK